MSYLTERLLHTEHEEGCCCGECGCENEHDHEEIVEKSLSESEIEGIISKKYSEKDEKTKEFIRKGLRKFGDRFDYSKTVYIKAQEKVTITCRKHNTDFEQVAHEHYRPVRFNACNPCPDCQAEYKRSKYSKSQEDFIKDAISVHKDKYGYDRVKYVNDHTNVEIYCKKCGKYFWQSPSNHFRGSGCPICGEKLRIKNRTKSFQNFLDKAHEVHGYTYDYSKSEKDYVNRESKIIIICREHGEFVQEASNHLSGNGCPQCGLDRVGDYNRYNAEDVLKSLQEIAGDYLIFPDFTYTTIDSPVDAVCINCGTSFRIRPVTIRQYPDIIHCPVCCWISHRMSQEDFIKRVTEVHEFDGYDYSEAFYCDIDTPVKIYDCLLKEFFWQTPRVHLQGSGNPRRSKSRGAIWTENWLVHNSIEYISEYRLDIFNERGVRIDFRLHYNNVEIFIEYNGGQHYRKIDYFHKTQEEFDHQIQRDKFIENYCNSKGIKLIVVPYILSDYHSLSDFLTKTIIEGIDPHLLINYDSLYVFDDNST